MGVSDNGAEPERDWEPHPSADELKLVSNSGRQGKCSKIFQWFLRFDTKQELDDWA